MVDRARSGNQGPGQRLAVAIHEVGKRIAGRDNEIAIRRPPTHQGVEGMRRRTPGPRPQLGADPPRTTRTTSKRPVGRTRQAERREQDPRPPETGLQGMFGAPDDIGYRRATTSAMGYGANERP